VLARCLKDAWRGVRRVRIPVSAGGSAGTIVFDWKSTVHAAGEPGLVLTLGYNTAVFCALYRLTGLNNVINMDGVEWRRQKWGGVAKLWFWLNDWAGCWLGNHLVADHPEIKKASGYAGGRYCLSEYDCKVVRNCCEASA